MMVYLSAWTLSDPPEVGYKITINKWKKFAKSKEKKMTIFIFLTIFFLKKKNLFSIEKYPKKFEKNLTNFFAIFVFEGMKAQIGSDIS